MIEMNKKYRTRDVLAVRVLCTNVKSKHPVIAAVSDTTGEKVHCYTQTGTIGDYKCGLDLVEVSPYEDFKIDDPVMVCVSGTSWHKRHFAGVTTTGLPLTFIDGFTSFTTKATTDWAECRKPTPEEMK